jgi:diaminohydroxyphosphoribosylaminopyrimidine deaminase / 5-amino-6-(5-phosphoribosylamino)uracil reductase
MNHINYMRRALQLAALGAGQVAPNPLVGCVIVHQGKIIGEGYHQRYGQAHAEVNAIVSVEDKSLLSKSAVYVTLEPCSHFGKTPPCADLLIRHQVKEVIVCNTDPNPLVNGKGIHKLNEAGIKTTVGVLGEEGLWLNRRFFTFIQKQRPYIVLKYAQSQDGFIARPNYKAHSISNQLSNRLVHQWRATESAIMVGTNTALYDDPNLNLRHWTGQNPTRIVIDRNLRLPSHLKLFDQSQPTLVFTESDTENLSKKNLEFIKLPNTNFLDKLFVELYDKKIQSVFVEGGTALLESLVKANLWDEARVITSPKRLYDGIKSPNTNFGENTTEQQLLDDDTLVIYQNFFLDKKAV